MADAIAFGAARGGERIIYLQPAGTLGIRVDRCIAQRGQLRVYLDRQVGEHLHDFGARARDQLDELEALAETVEQAWPRCDGERPSEAHHWIAAGFDDATTVAWLEVGVPWATAAAELRAVKLEPRDVAIEHADGVTIGLAYARRGLTLAEVQRAVLGEEVR